MKIDKEKLSPMMKQYIATKEQYPDCILFYRLGDFYEMFFDDAIRVSRELELTLTGRDCGLEERAPMCGVPYHSVDIYLKRLVERGYKIAICEQLTEPSSKGLVERDVIRIVTPGTLIESNMLEEGVNNYICSLYFEENKKLCGICFADLSTGEMTVIPVGEKEVESQVIDSLSRFMPSEIILNEDALSLKAVMEFIKIRLQCVVTMRDDICFSPDKKSSLLCEQFSVESVKMLGISETGADICSVCGLFDYIYETQKNNIGRFISIDVSSSSAFMGLDLNARRNLELTETIRGKEKKGSLLWLLNDAKTSMGKRMLKTWLEQPLVQPVKIMARLDAVEAFFKNSVVLRETRELLNNVYDLERLMTRVLYKTATPRDLQSLATTAKQIPELKNQLEKLSDVKLLSNLNSQISTLSSVADLVEKAIMENPPVSVKDGGVIRDGFNKELDNLREIMSGGNQIIAKIEQREKERTGIKGLKIGFNRVFGYYIEVTRSYYNLVPDDYIRKQTLANSERFITNELKRTENDILLAKEKSLRLEENIYAEVRECLSLQLKSVQSTASAIAQVDVLSTFASVSIENQYIKPEIAIDGSIQISNGRHPVIERMLEDTPFVPNDTYIDTKENRMLLITGPNMAGKSTYMRQVAIITLMAQIGCFVPADYAKISVVDKIFTRVGASDDLTSGQSTFMVEMREVSDILKHATKDSLVILDEVGRGTSTYDGVSIAQAVAEYISSKKIGCKTLFATHYHELIGLEKTLDGVKNYSIAVKKHGESIRFLRKIVEGGIDDSYGIEVAKLAGLPDKVVKRARQLLAQMESKDYEKNLNLKNNENMQFSFEAIQHENVVNVLKKTNISELSDFECREVLEEVISMIKK